MDRHAVTKMHFAYSLLPSGTLQVLQVCPTTSTLAVKKKKYDLLDLLDLYYVLSVSQIGGQRLWGVRISATAARP